MTQMFRALRTAPTVRLVLALAAILSIGASLGLHPEPADAMGTGSDVALSSTVVADSASQRCLACLAFGATLIPAVPRVSLVGVTPESAAPGALANTIARLAHRDLSGRSPPAGP